MSLVLLVVACALLGSGFGPLLAGEAQSRPFRWLIYFLAGLVQLHLVLRVLDLLDVRWSRLAVGAVLVALYLSGRALCRRRRVPPPGAVPVGWGDVLAVVPWVGFAVLSWRGQITMSDFIYQWGPKAQRYFLAGGIDLEYLTRPWNRFAHPNYPHLLPELYALTAEVGGRFHPPEILLWSSVFLLGILIAGREALAAGGALSGGRSDVRHLVLAILAFTLAAFGIGHRMAGAADWVVALALLASVPVMLALDRRADLQIGVLAAVAASAKVEGMVLAGLLVTVHLARRLRRRRFSAASLVRTAAPALLCLALWASLVWRHDLLVSPPGGQAILGGPDLARLPIVLTALADPATLAPWHGLALVLGLGPLLLASRGLRPLAAICAGQLALYLYVYLSAEVDTAFYVRSSAPRLVLHLLPAVLVGVGRVLEQWARTRPDPKTAASPSSAAAGVYDSAAPSHPFDDEFRDLFDRLDMVWLWSQRTIKLRYKRSLLGVVWTLIEPLAIISILALVFSTLFRFETPNYPIYVLSGWVLWDFFSKSTSAMVREVEDGWRLSSGVRLSRSVFLAAAAVTHLVHWLPALLLVVMVMAVLGHPITWALLSLPLAMVLAAVFALGVGLIVSTVTAFFHDFALMYQVLLTIWLYATPLIYPLAIVPEKARPLFLLNPLTHLLALVRAPIYQGTLPPASAWLSATAVSLAVFAAGWWLFTSLRGALAARAH